MTVVIGVLVAALLFGAFTLLRPADKGCTGNCVGCLRNGQGTDRHQRARGTRRAEQPVPWTGDAWPRRDVGDELGDLDNVIQAAAEMLDDALDVSVALLGLRLGVTRPDEYTGRIER